MSNANSFSTESRRPAPRAERHVDLFQDWVPQLVLVIAIVAALVQCVMSLNGATMF